MIVMMNDCISLNSLGIRCKDNYHKLCDGEWKGLGFTVMCKCNFILVYEKNIVLDGFDESSNTYNSNQQRGQENMIIDCNNKDKNKDFCETKENIVFGYQISVRSIVEIKYNYYPGELL